MSTASALPQTLKSITNTKIRELSKQRELFEKRRDEIVKTAEAAKDLRSKVRVLLEGVTKLKGHPNDAIDQEDMDLDCTDEYAMKAKDGTERAIHVNIRRFLLQGQYDPSVSDTSLKEWVAQLEKELQHMDQGHDHAAFYSKLVTEWLDELESKSSSLAKDDHDPELVGRSEMHKQRQTWESLVFNTTDVSEDAIRTYLDLLFTKTKFSKQALKELRESIKSFATSFSAKKKWFTVADLEWVSKSLIKTDFLSKEKAVILKELTRNQSVAQEVVDVLNMRLASLDSWSWPAEGVLVEMRRQLNGKYRVFMDEDLLDSIMFHYLGLKWAVTFRRTVTSFLHSRGWKRSRENIPEKEKLRRSYFFPNMFESSRNVNDHRHSVYVKEYFMTQLPRSESEDVPDYNDEGPHDSQGKNALDTKHSLLHLLLTESLIHTTLHGQFTAIRSDFRWFGPSLPHTTILTVLSYFGVPQNWLGFFRTFLEAPLKFAHDGSNAVPLIRAQGVPICHTLSDFLGETVLFCMDYAVNQSTEGAHLYRMHDDFWFWGKENMCHKAWHAMTEFAQIMGLEFNEKKSGTVRLTGRDASFHQGQAVESPLDNATEQEESTSLPPGNICWGFLIFDSKSHRFTIDQEMVETHILELQRQLLSCKSVFAWVQAWNSYFGKFFVNNFAKPAMCFGRDHIDMALSTLAHIERTIFASSTDGARKSVTDHLRKMIAERFDVHDLPEGLFYFPIELGGLNLLNPYIPLLAMRENITQTPHHRLRKALLESEAEYQYEKERFDKHGPSKSWPHSGTPGEFPSFQEYIHNAESYSSHLLDAYVDLMNVPSEASAGLTPTLRGYQVLLDKEIFMSTRSRGIISNEWRNMSPYWRWTAELYQEGMVKKYGSLAAVNREFMPVGVVETLREGKFRWQG